MVIFIANQDISKNDLWPPGTIEAVPVKFPVHWRIEMPQEESGFLEAVYGSLLLQARTQGRLKTFTHSYIQPMKNSKQWAELSREAYHTPAC
jgi:hypothetical protein